MNKNNKTNDDIRLKKFYKSICEDTDIFNYIGHSYIDSLKYKYRKKTFLKRITSKKINIIEAKIKNNYNSDVILKNTENKDNEKLSIEKDNNNVINDNNIEEETNDFTTIESKDKKVIEKDIEKDINNNNNNISNENNKLEEFIINTQKLYAYRCCSQIVIKSTELVLELKNYHYSLLLKYFILIRDKNLSIFINSINCICDFNKEIIKNKDLNIFNFESLIKDNGLNSYDILCLCISYAKLKEKLANMSEYDLQTLRGKYIYSYNEYKKRLKYRNFEYKFGKFVCFTDAVFATEIFIIKVNSIKTIIRKYKDSKFTIDYNVHFILAVKKIANLLKFFYKNFVYFESFEYSSNCINRLLSKEINENNFVKANDMDKLLLYDKELLI